MVLPFPDAVEEKWPRNQAEEAAIDIGLSTGLELACDSVSEIG